MDPKGRAGNRLHRARARPASDALSPEGTAIDGEAPATANEAPFHGVTGMSCPERRRQAQSTLARAGAALPCPRPP